MNEISLLGTIRVIRQVGQRQSEKDPLQKQRKALHSISQTLRSEEREWLEVQPSAIHLNSLVERL
jgi:hypothetical protein